MTVKRRNNVHIIGKSDQTIIFAHGFGSDQSAWRHIVNAFKDEYRILLFDHVGCGNSDSTMFSPFRHSNLFGYAEDLLEICQEFNLNNTIYVGHSVSGMVGILAAQVNSSFFKKMILLGASPRYLNDVNYLGGFDQSDLNMLYENMSSNYYGWVSGFASLVMGNPDQPKLVQEFADTLKAMRPDISLQIARAIFESDHRKDLPTVQTSTLILQSKDDIAVPIDVGQYIHKNMVHSSYKLLDSTGHFPHLSAPDQVINAIKEYIR